MSQQDERDELEEAHNRSLLRDYHCTCSHMYRGVRVFEAQLWDRRCPQHGIGTEWARREGLTE